jgi:transposase
MEFGFETDLWTTERVVKLIEEKFGVRYYPDHVLDFGRFFQHGFG